MQNATILLVHLNVIACLGISEMDLTVQVNSCIDVIIAANTFEKLKKIGFTFNIIIEDAFTVAFGSNSVRKIIIKPGTSFILYLDVDECSLSKDICHLNAECNNTIGSFECQCLSGYIGNGSNCTGEQID